MRLHYVGIDGGADRLPPASPPTIFNAIIRRRFSDVSDGLSNTTALSEVITAGGNSEDVRGQWCHEFGMAYTHELPPNSPLPDRLASYLCPFACVSIPGAPITGGQPGWRAATLTARSRHPSGVNVALGDGSVRFVANSISLQTWQAAATIAGGEVLGSDW